MADNKTLKDYEADIPAMMALFADRPEIQVKISELTPGYQREWARFIFGVKAQATQQRHLDQMETVLKAGYKSKRAYDQRSSK